MPCPVTTTITVTRCGRIAEQDATYTSKVAEARVEELGLVLEKFNRSKFLAPRVRVFRTFNSREGSDGNFEGMIDLSPTVAMASRASTPA